MFNLGFIFMVNDSSELSVTFVPLVLPEQTPMVEVFKKKQDNVLYILEKHIQFLNIPALSSVAFSRRCAWNCGHVCV